MEGGVHGDPVPRRCRRILRVPVDIGEELGRREFAALHVALELRHIHAVGGEAPEPFVERSGHVAHAKDEGRHHRPFARRRPAFIPRQHDETGRVVALILDVRG